MITLAIDNENWDLMVDEYGNIATKSNAEQIAQDVSSSVRVFRGEVPFDIYRGVEYNKPDENRNTLKQEILEQVYYIDGVGDVLIDFVELKDRTLRPIIYLTTEDGENITVGEQNVRAN